MLITIMIIEFQHSCTMCQFTHDDDFNIIHSHSAGPPNVPFTKKPYKDLEVEDPSITTTSTSKKEKKERKSDSQKPSHPSLYPSLPSNTDAQQPVMGNPPPIGAHYYQQPSQGQTFQGYGAPTYPNQQVYQQQGVPYWSGQAAVDERTRLINQ